MYDLCSNAFGTIDAMWRLESFPELKKFLIENVETIYSWITKLDSSAKLPDFSKANSIEDLEVIFNEYSYSFWSVCIYASEY